MRPAALQLRRPTALPLACATLAAVVALIVYAGGPPGVDVPAHLFQTWLYSHGGFEVWNNYWYAGRYEFVSYSVLYYPLAALAGQAAVTALAAAALAGSFSALARREWGTAARGPAIALAVTAPLIAMLSGAYPFLAGCGAAAAALLAVQRRWRIVFAVATLATLGFSPLAFALLLALLATALLGQARPLEALRHQRVTFGIVLAVFAAGVLAQRAFPSGGAYPYSLTDAALVTAFSLAGLYVTGSSPRARSLRVLFAGYLLLNLIAFLLHGPIGSNSTRLFAIAGAPLLWLAANVGEARSRRVVLPVLAAALALQVGPFVRDGFSSWQNPAASAAFWRPAERFLTARRDTGYRVEVVATWGHWEAYYLAKRGIPLARGWFRQDDFPLNQPLYSPHLTGAVYRAWLRRLGVRYVLLPAAPLDYSAVAEARLLRSGRSGLVLVSQDRRWSVFRLRRPRPIVTPVRPARGELSHMTSGTLVVHARTPGTFLVRVHFSPYWEASPSIACARPAADGMTLLSTPVAGWVRLSLSPGLGDLAGAVARTRDRC